MALFFFAAMTSKAIDDFHRFIESFGLDNFKYADSFSNAVRHNRTERVFTANEAPPNVEIFLHHEMAQTLTFQAHSSSFVSKQPNLVAQPRLPIGSHAKNAGSREPKFRSQTRKVG